MDQHDDADRRHLEPAPIVGAGEIDGGVTPQHLLGNHPAADVDNQHDLDGDLLPVDMTADIGKESLSSSQSETSSSG
jgi:hypothetical protein